ncbi:MAG: hypothetical protein DHS20C15_04420 [Planctomycetota bacterium]|nr:MAG: hypothetical protein DHS20C15_04420 [Planctomycetota bacterium]
MSEAFLELRDVNVRFTGGQGPAVHALRDISLSIRAGETLALIGTSGSGKTTLLRVLNRLQPPTSGAVLLQGADLVTRDPLELRRGMGYVIQAGGLLPHLTVAENVALLGKLGGHDAARREARTRELLELVHLPPHEFAARWPDELSGGQRQRVGVARALYLDPPVLLMDEPFGALDPITRAELRREFAELEGHVQKTVVLVTHDLAEARELADRVALLDAGRLHQVGSFEELCAQPADDFVAAFMAEHEATT